MKTLKKVMTAALMVISASIYSVYAQETDTVSTEKKLSLTPGLNVYTRYVWRGTDFGNNPSLQPYLEFKYKRLTVGGAGAYDIKGGYQEADWYAKALLGYGLSMGITDYYFPGSVVSVTDSSGTTLLGGLDEGKYFSNGHSLEINAIWEFHALTLTFNIMGYTPVETNDIYIEGSYAFTPQVKLIIGAGNEAYTSNGKFMVCHVGVQGEKAIPLYKDYAIKISAALIVNPEKEHFYIVGGILF
jgi:hypothetical protein